MNKNGKTKRAGSGRNDDIAQDQQKSVGGIQCDGEGYGIQGQIGPAEGDSPRQGSASKPRPVGTHVGGKILERLELVEKNLYAYIHGHQDRLEARLQESKQLEAALTEELQAVKEEISRLAEAGLPESQEMTK